MLRRPCLVSPLLVTFSSHHSSARQQPLQREQIRNKGIIGTAFDTRVGTERSNPLKDMRKAGNMRLDRTEHKPETSGLTKKSDQNHVVRLLLFMLFVYFVMNFGD